MASRRENELEKEVSELKELVTKLLARIDVLEEENAELKRRLGMDSNNSSKPPSSDGYKPKPKSLRKTGGKNGGQPGHTGKTLKMSDKPDEVVVLKAEICPHCQREQANMPVIRIEKLKS